MMQVISIKYFLNLSLFNRHNVSISLREAPKVVEAIIHGYYRGCMKVAQLRLEEDLEKAKALQNEKELEEAHQKQRLMMTFKKIWTTKRSNALCHSQLVSFWQTRKW